MATAQLIIVCVTVLLALFLHRPDRGARESEPELTAGVPVTVRTRRPDDQTLHGTLLSQTPGPNGYLTLADAAYVTAAGVESLRSPTTRVPRVNVAFITEHPRAGGDG